MSEVQPDGRQLCDTHVHLDFIANAPQVVADAATRGLALFANTVTPAGYLAAREQAWSRAANVRLGVGMHPWWVADGRVSASDVQLFCELAAGSRYIGEIGLDFSDKHTDPTSHEAQVETFTAAARSCAKNEKVVSIHSVRAVDAVLGVLESTGALRKSHCIFHWFSGSTPELWRAIHAGCYFSVNEMQVRTRKAKEQLKLIPRDRLLLETDLPPGEDVTFSAEQIEASLQHALAGLEQIRGEELASICQRNASNLLA
jgi:TatD DNase family protein